MPGPFETDADSDPQDRAETYDETNLTESGDLGEARSYADADRRRASEDLPDVVDLLQRTGDRDEDEALALDADEFDEDSVDDEDLEADDELDYRAADEEHEDDLDGLGPEDGFDAAGVASDEIDGLSIVRDADEAEGGEDDFTDFEAKGVDDEALRDLGYSEERDGQTRAKPND